MERPSTLPLVAQLATRFHTIVACATSEAVTAPALRQGDVSVRVRNRSERFVTNSGVEHSRLPNHSLMDRADHVEEHRVKPTRRQAGRNWSILVTVTSDDPKNGIHNAWRLCRTSSRSRETQSASAVASRQPSSSSLLSTRYELKTRDPKLLETAAYMREYEGRVMHRATAAE